MGQRALTHPTDREAAWEIYKDANPPLGQALHYYKDNREYWLAGYEAGCQHARAQSEKDVAELEKQIYESIELNRFNDKVTDLTEYGEGANAAMDCLRFSIEKVFKHFAKHKAKETT